VDSKALAAARDARLASRFPTRIKAALHAGHRRLPIVIDDISKTGAMISGGVLPTRGERVWLLADGLKVDATVMWHSGTSCGLSFHAPVDPLAVVRENHEQFAWMRRKPQAPGETLAE
jgi:hypothetical protein